jgi:hypothetical protein
VALCHQNTTIDRGRARCAGGQRPQIVAFAATWRDHISLEASGRIELAVHPLDPIEIHDDRPAQIREPRQLARFFNRVGAP